MLLTVWNSGSFSEADPDHAVVLIIANWENAEDGKEMKEATNRLGKPIQDKTRQSIC